MSIKALPLCICLAATAGHKAENLPQNPEAARRPKLLHNYEAEGMIVGLGLDLVEIPRIRRAHERFGPHFARKILHERELAEMPQNPVDYLAGRFAAKEAAVKALGTGFIGVWFQDFCVLKAANGQPELIFLGPALERLHALGGERVLLSITHSRDTAAAVVILEK